MKSSENQMNRPAIVYAAQEPMVKNGQGYWEPNPTFDLTGLAEFGHVQFIWVPGATSFSPDHLRKRALETASLFNDSRDWLVNLGSPSLIAMLAWALGRQGKDLRVLEWDRRLKAYIPTLHHEVNT